MARRKNRIAAAVSAIGQSQKLTPTYKGPTYKGEGVSTEFAYRRSSIAM